MDLPIVALLAQDGITNGAVYALLALALVLVFAVTRVIWVPSGEFVAYGTLTLAGLQLGKASGIAGMLAAMAVVAGLMEIASAIRHRDVRHLARSLSLWAGVPLAIAALIHFVAPLQPPFLSRYCSRSPRSRRSGRCSTGSRTSRSPRPACWCC